MKPLGERNQLSAFRSTAASAAVLMLAAALFLGWMLFSSWQRHREEAKNNLQNVTFNLERSLFSTLQSADLVLQSAQQAFTRLSAHNAAERAAVTEVVQGLGNLLPEATDLRGADAQGYVLYGVGSDATQPVNVRDRKYFQEARASSSMVVGLPLLSRVTQRWVLPVARALRTPNGDFAGVAYVLLPLQDIQLNLSGLKLGTQGVATVFNHRSEILVRSVKLKPKSDEDGSFFVGPDMRQAVREGRANQPFASRSGVDGLKRLSLYRQVGTYPVYVAVGLEYGEMMAPWWHEVTVAIASWLVLLLSALGYVYSQGRSMQRHNLILAELDEARRHSEEVARYKSQFLANMSHEIRTPLNGVLGFAQVGYRLPGGTPDHQQAFMRILDAGTLLHGVLNDVLDMAKIEAGKLELRPEPTLLQPLVERMVCLVRTQAETKGVALRVELSESVPAVMVVDALRLEQILMNLMSNAVKFTERGRVSLSVHALEDSIAFTVKDSGVGMPREHMERLFKAFEQADGSTTRRFGGTGLGLTITKRLVDMMGGHIEVTSQPQVGSVFVVRLPLRRSVELTPAAAPGASGPVRMTSKAQKARRLAGLHVLVAEDNEVNQMVMKAMLQSEGARASIVGDGEQALQWLARQQPEELPAAVLMDVQMPVMDGYEAARQIRAAYPGLPVIGQTAHALPEDRLRCLDAGMVERLVKPLELEHLVAALLAHARYEAGESEVSRRDAAGG